MASPRVKSALVMDSRVDLIHEPCDQRVAWATALTHEHVGMNAHGIRRKGRPRRTIRVTTNPLNGLPTYHLDCGHCSIGDIQVTDANVRRWLLAGDSRHYV
jgi:hypothetical protein